MICLLKIIYSVYTCTEITCVSNFIYVNEKTFLQTFVFNHFNSFEIKIISNPII